MLTLPALGRVPQDLRARSLQPLAARLALAIAPAGEICVRVDNANVEIDALREHLQAWYARATAHPVRARPRLHFALGMGPTEYSERKSKDGYTVWLLPRDHANTLVGSIWCMERRWKVLEAQAPGLAATALAAIGEAGLHSLPMYTPAVAEYYACNMHWWGEDDEAEVLANYREEIGKPDAPVPDDMFTRAKFDRALPPAVCRARSKLNQRALERLARRPINARGERGDAGEIVEIARAVLELQAAVRASASRSRRRDKGAEGFHLETQDANGYQAISFAATLRWNAADPMLQLFDDRANEAANSEGAEEAFGWYEMQGAAQLPALLAEIERSFALAGMVEDLLPRIATRWQP